MIYILGGIIGFSYFIYQLESDDIGNIIFRTNSDGIKELSIFSILNVMIAPFQYKQFWTDYKLIKTNWIILVNIGIINAIIIDKFIL